MTKLKRKNNKKYAFYRVYDATNNEASQKFYSFKEAKKYAFSWLKNQGITCEIVGYKNCDAYTVARCENF